ncbi:zinc-dependent peptidase [Alisedimentitalea sp. MJ-SS2]|uniref:M90 family metallopeptidase n=1 Tax=Aliisedimentitalea sp. MJ-SS2 TaxID=3049795 RepID=UPI00290DA250|nr:zinc-dependent peptidase [Alisedimentitalea sp. MJ-SS2]MDU8926501.1 zinc-dependent peptidase [Alisedimentitalea sp. MJ-SS2]
MPLLIFLGFVVLIAGYLGYRALTRRRKRQSLLATPLSDHQRRIIDEQVPILRRLPSELHRNLEGRVNVFLNQVRFHGCDGLELTEEMELSIAVQACLLVVNSDTWYDGLTTILVYPFAFKSKQAKQDGYVVFEEESVRLGESWRHGPVILSWAHSEQGAINDVDGQNLVLHEFAHKLDELTGEANGIPLLGKGHSFTEWENVFVKAYKTHVANVEKGRKTVIDAYGATNYEEFFAVSIEVFFERPLALFREEPEVYAQLSKLLRLDPKVWG